MSEARPALAKIATDALAAERLETTEPTAVKRARAVALIAATIANEARLRRRRRIGVAMAAAAAAAIVVTIGSIRHRPIAPPTPIEVAHASTVTGTVHALSGNADIVHSGQAQPLDASMALVAGDSVLAHQDGRAAITLSTGTHIVVEGDGDVVVVEQDATQIYALQSGALQADVAKLSEGERFFVRTRDAEIEVRGTSFHMSVVAPDASCGAGTITRLSVSEGVVVVRASGVETRVTAGDFWPRDCAAQKDFVAPQKSDSPSAPVLPSNAAAYGSKLPASELAAQNDVFAQATAAKNGGDVSGAIAGYERYLVKYPGGPLAESATVERMRLLASIDSRRAAVAAKAYLARYPNGFARDEAERLAAEGS